MNDALMQEEPARDTTVFKKAMKEEATWETDIGMLISQVQVAQVATCSSDMKGLVMDPELKIIRLCYQGYEHLVACQSASGLSASDLRQYISIYLHIATYLCVSEREVIFIKGMSATPNSNHTYYSLTFLLYPAAYLVRLAVS